MEYFNFKLDMNTILGQAINHTLKKDYSIGIYTSDLIANLNNEAYIYNDDVFSNKFLCVTDDIKDIFNHKYIVYTSLVYEVSWLVYELEDIYSNYLNEQTYNIFYSTLSNLLNLFIKNEKMEDSQEIFEDLAERISVMMMGWIHPSHIKNLTFKTPVMKFPTKPIY